MTRTANTLQHHPIGRKNPVTLPADMETGAFLDWVDEQLDIEIAERGGFTDREAEDFADKCKSNPGWLEKMLVIYNREASC